MPAPLHNAALLTALQLLLAWSLAPMVGAQPTPAGNYDYLTGQVRITPPMVVLLIALITAFFFIGFFTIYIRHCGRDSTADNNFNPSAGILGQRQRQRGLDAEVIESFPTMKYSEAKALRVGKAAALECAVCLSEFEEDEQLRFLPKCSHAFHPYCIGEWLAGHSTCPVCRCNLEPDKDSAEQGQQPGASAPQTGTSGEAAVLQQDGGVQPAAVVIDVHTEEERRKEALDLERIGSQRRALRTLSGRPSAASFARSHSTGHSVAVRLDGDLERFTLRLPEHLRREMVAAGEESLRRGRRAAEGSSRGGGARSVRLGRSDRWPSFLARTFSARVPFLSASWRGDAADGAEGSTTKGRAKRVAAADGAEGSAKGSVRLDCHGGGVSAARAGSMGGEEAVAEEKAIAQQV